MARRGQRRALIVVVTGAVMSVGLMFLLLSPAGPRTLTRFDPDRVAHLETSMWQAYYAKERVRLFGLLVTTLREQYGYSWARALQAGVHFARAAARFGDMRGNYERVLPDLQAGYGIARDWTGASFDPDAVARAELAWWVARRTPGESDATNVGQLIGKEYALLYAMPVDRVAHAAELRARAGQMRDAAGIHADWTAIEGLLVQSYRDLKAVVGPASTPPR